MYNSKVFTADLFINTNQIITPILDSSKKISLGTPSYLNNAKKQISFQLKGNFFPHEQVPTMSIFLMLADTCANILNSASNFKTNNKKNKTIIESISSTFVLDGKKWNLFLPENKQEIVKDSLNVNLKLNFK